MVQFSEETKVGSSSMQMFSAYSSPANQTFWFSGENLQGHWRLESRYPLVIHPFGEVFFILVTVLTVLFLQWLSASDNLSGYGTRPSDSILWEMLTTGTGYTYSEPRPTLFKYTSAKSCSFDSRQLILRTGCFRPSLKKADDRNLGLWKLVFRLEWYSLSHHPRRLFLSQTQRLRGGTGDSRALIHTSRRCFQYHIDTHVFLNLFHVCEMFCAFNRLMILLPSRNAMPF